MDEFLYNYDALFAPNFVTFIFSPFIVCLAYRKIRKYDDELFLIRIGNIRNVFLCMIIDIVINSIIVVALMNVLILCVYIISGKLLNIYILKIVLSGCLKQLVFWNLIGCIYMFISILIRANRLAAIFSMFVVGIMIYMVYLQKYIGELKYNWYMSLVIYEYQIGTSKFLFHIMVNSITSMLLLISSYALFCKRDFYGVDKQ